MNILSPLISLYSLLLIVKFCDGTTEFFRDGTTEYSVVSQIVLPSLDDIAHCWFWHISRVFKLSVFSMQCEHLISPNQFVFCLLSKFCDGTTDLSVTGPRNIHWSPQIVSHSLDDIAHCWFWHISRLFKLSVFAMQCSLIKLWTSYLPWSVCIAFLLIVKFCDGTTDLSVTGPRICPWRDHGIFIGRHRLLHIHWTILPIAIADFDTLSRLFKLSVFAMQCSLIKLWTSYLPWSVCIAFCLLSNSVMTPRIFSWWTHG